MTPRPTKLLKWLIGCWLLSGSLASSGYVQAAAASDSCNSLQASVALSPVHSQANPSADALLALPESLCEAIFSFFSPPELVRTLCFVSKKSHQYAQSRAVWKQWRAEVSFVWYINRRALTISLYTPTQAPYQFRFHTTEGTVALAYKYAPYLRYKTLELINNTHAAPAQTWNLTALERAIDLQYLYIEGGSVDARAYPKFRKCPHLRILRLQGINGLAELDFLVTLSKLTRFSLQVATGTRINSWLPLAKCQQLTHLGVASESEGKGERLWTVLNNRRLQNTLEFLSLTAFWTAPPFDPITLKWEAFRRLQELEIDNCSWVDMSPLTPLSNQLTALSCKEWHQLTTLAHLSDFRELHRLLLCNCRSVENLEGIQDLPALHVLGLHFLNSAINWVAQLTAPEACLALKEVYYGSGLNLGLWNMAAERAALCQARPNLVVQGYVQYKEAHASGHHFDRAVIR